MLTVYTQMLMLTMSTLLFKGKHVKHRYQITKEQEETQWDAIVIGSGLGGMSAAVGMASQGMKVLLLEQHSVPGGYATSFKRKGFTFEVSLHNTSSLGPGGALNAILTEYGVMDKIHPITLDETMRIKTADFDISMGAEYLNELRRLFPHESAGIDKLNDILDRVLREMPRLMRLSLLPSWLYRLIGYLLAPTAMRYRNSTLEQLLDELFTDRKVRELTAIQWGYFGLPMGRISALLYILG